MHSDDDRPRAIFLMGPTASGKTRLACELASSYPLDLISVDSALVYRGMEIGTAKPDRQTLALHPHRLIDIREPGEPYSAADFHRDALIEMEKITIAGRIPLLVGGTGLYFRALERGLSPMPQADATIRAGLVLAAQRLGKAQMHARLAQLDPQTAARLDVNDTQRIQRALEVIELTGRALSDLHADVRERLPFHILKLALLPQDRAPLHARIGARFDAMLEQGLLDELQRLRRRQDWSADLPSMRAVGYRQGWDYLDGKITLEAFRSNAVAATRQLAKRQITWLRSELDTRQFDPDTDGVADRVEASVAGFLGD